MTTKLAEDGYTFENGAVHVDPDVAYPAALEGIGAPPELDQFWLEAAHQCIKLEAARLVLGTDNQPKGAALVVVINSGKLKDGTSPWAGSNFPMGKGAAAATQGREARELYRKWRGFIPG